MAHAAQLELDCSVTHLKLCSGLVQPFICTEAVPTQAQWRDL